MCYALQLNVYTQHAWCYFFFFVDGFLQFNNDSNNFMRWMWYVIVGYIFAISTITSSENIILIAHITIYSICKPFRSILRPLEYLIEIASCWNTRAQYATVYYVRFSCNVSVYNLFHISEAFLFCSSNEKESEKTKRNECSQRYCSHNFVFDIWKMFGSQLLAIDASSKDDGYWNLICVVCFDMCHRARAPTREYCGNTNGKKSPIILAAQSDRSNNVPLQI